MNTQHLENRRCLLQVPSSQNEGTYTAASHNTNNELILLNCEWKCSLCREMGWKRSTSYLNAGAQVKFCCADHPWNIHLHRTKKKMSGWYELKGTVYIRKMCCPIYIFRFFFSCLILCLFWNVIFFWYFLHSMYVFHCKSKYEVIVKMRARSEVQSLNAVPTVNCVCCAPFLSYLS